MRVGRFTFATRKLTASLVLAAFALRALVPAGFMLAEGHPLTVIICPDGFPAQLLTQDGHAAAGMADMPGMANMPGMDTMPGMPAAPDGSHSHSEHCLFTSGSSHGPISVHASPAFVVYLIRQAAVAPPQLARNVRLVYVPQARAPPTLA